MSVVELLERAVIPICRAARQLELAIAIIGDELWASSHAGSMTPTEGKTRNP
jgi:hypothetical protein